MDHRQNLCREFPAFQVKKLMREKISIARDLVGNSEGKRLLGRPRHRWEDEIKMVLRKIGWSGMDWIHLAPDRDQWRILVKMLMNLQVS
jgi:hypothetical protein